jgi:hypothetical protein
LAIAKSGNFGEVRAPLGKRNYAHAA